ncbi:uncharacterized protein DS421_17g577020 [Arachis hypogaea]|nr:uncharacterized protein DS421_17g577020 [Arachis hypogaea]
MEKSYIVFVPFQQFHLHSLVAVPSTVAVSSALPSDSSVCTFFRQRQFYLHFLPTVPSVLHSDSGSFDRLHFLQTAAVLSTLPSNIGSSICASFRQLRLHMFYQFMHFFISLF